MALALVERGAAAGEDQVDYVGGFEGIAATAVAGVSALPAVPDPSQDLLPKVLEPVQGTLLPRE